MLREAGECVDPDAEAEPVPAPLRLAPPPMAEAAPAVAAPAGGKVIAAPDRFRRPPGLAAAAAMLPIAVALWIIFGIDRPKTFELMAENLGGAKLPGTLDDPLPHDLRGGPGDHLSEDAKKNLFASGAWLVDLELAIKKENARDALDRLNRLKGTLESFDRILLDPVATELESTQVEWRDVQRALDRAYKDLFDDNSWQRFLDQGSCVRGAWLALKSGDSQFATRDKIKNRCPKVVGAWPPTEKQLENMLDSQSVVLEPQQ
jgi:hypothetical protein